MRGVQEPPETRGPKDGSGTPGPRAGLACSGSWEKKVRVGARGGLLSGRLAALVRDGQSPRPASRVLNVLLVRKGPEGSKDSWATQAPPGVWETEAPKDPKEIEDSRVSESQRGRP